MKLVRFNQNRLGIYRDNSIVDVSDVLEQLPARTWPLEPGDPLISNLSSLMPAIEDLAKNGKQYPLSDVMLESPITSPSKILAAPVNYKKHLDEARADKELNQGTHIRTIDELGLFLKSSTSLVGPREGVALKWTDRRTDHEVELAAIIGQGGRDISKENAMAHVAGYCIGLDISIRGTEDRSFRKSFDSFTVLGPWFVSADELGDPHNLDFWIKINGETRQESNTNMLIWDIPKLIEYASSAYTLYPGDVLLTGTPEGVSPITAGDVMTCWIENIGEMTVPVS
ncbi:MAG: fumarylacetoacetate hydrolase family protein [Methyloligellaceae bacterium]